MNFFGTDGIRGVANVHPLTPDFAMRVAMAASKILAREKRSGENSGAVIIGSDTRHSGNMLASAVEAGLMSTGLDVINLDVVPTAGVAYLTAHLGAAFGVMISASHNPFWDNGIKIFSGEGFKLSEETEKLIEDELFHEITERPTHAKIGRKIRANRFLVDPVSRYAEFVESMIEKGEGGRKKLKVVIDGANGAASGLVKRIFGEKFDVSAIHCSPDGQNINLDCGSTHLTALARTVKAEKANLGVAFDGDSDRALFVDEKGNEIDGDHVIAMLAVDFKQRGLLKNNSVVTTVMSNLGFVNAMKREGVDLVTTVVGDRNVLSEMIHRGSVIGGEQSGHVILLDSNTTGDGIITAVSVLNLMRRSGKKLSELAKVFKKYPQVLINVRVTGDKNLYRSDPEIVGAIKEYEKKFLNRGRVLVRPSGTENIVRVMIEGENGDEISEAAESLSSLISRVLA